jgi:hypothetical protein
MDPHDFRPGGPAPDGDHPEPSRGSADQLSRRQALTRLGIGVAGGAAVWAAPEILIGRPTPAGAASAAPVGGPVRATGGGESSEGSGSGTVAPLAGQAGTGAGSAGSAGSAAGPSGEGSGPQLAFTGVNAERAFELGAGLLVGGWALTRWSGRRDGTDDTPAGPESEES